MAEEILNRFSLVAVWPLGILDWEQKLDLMQVPFARQANSRQPGARPFRISKESVRNEERLL